MKDTTNLDSHTSFTGSTHGWSSTQRRRWLLQRKLKIVQPRAWQRRSLYTLDSKPLKNLSISQSDDRTAKYLSRCLLEKYKSYVPWFQRFEKAQRFTFLINKSQTILMKIPTEINPENIRSLTIKEFLRKMVWNLQEKSKCRRLFFLLTKNESTNGLRKRKKTAEILLFSTIYEWKS